MGLISEILDRLHRFERSVWKHVEKVNSLCKGLILDNLKKRIANFKTETAKEIWDSIEK